MVKAVFLDFDWTLFAHDTHTIPDSAINALLEARRKGVHIILATGRSYSEMQEKSAAQYREIPFSGYITMNGVILLDEHEKMISGSPFRGEALDLIVKIFNEKKLPIVFATADSTYINFKNQRVVDAHKDITYIDHKVSSYTGEPVYLAVMYISREEEAEISKTLKGIDFKRWCSIGTDLIPAGMDKAEGVRKFAEILNIDLSECMAIGDSFNDIEMIKAVGYGVAMGNAEECTKEVSRYVTSDIRENGVANALKHFGVI